MVATLIIGGSAGIGAAYTVAAGKAKPLRRHPISFRERKSS
jgi:hypothetical protein